MIQYLLIANKDHTMTVVKVVNEKQIASYKINMDTASLDMILESFVISVPTSHGMNIAYGGEEKEVEG